MAGAYSLEHHLHHMLGDYRRSDCGIIHGAATLRWTEPAVDDIRLLHEAY